jgi:hypothetical protein
MSTQIKRLYQNN